LPEIKGKGFLCFNNRSGQRAHAGGFNV
jgi:hypothetical protein